MTNKEFFISSWEKDFPVTAKAFRSLPDDKDKLNFHHHAKFRSPWEIVNHIGPHAREISQALSEGKMDLVNEGKFDLAGPSIYKSCEDALVLPKLRRPAPFRVVRLRKGEERAGLQRLGEEIALQLVDTEGGKHRLGGLVLHALGYHAQAQ